MSIERLPDAAQTRDFDWGFHITALYYGGYNSGKARNQLVWGISLVYRY